MEIVQMSEIEKNVRRRYFQQSYAAQQSEMLTRTEVNFCRDTLDPKYESNPTRHGQPWGIDWSAPNRIVKLQNEFANFVNSFPPEAIATLNTPKPLSFDGIRRRIERWRVDSGKLHRTDCPPRRSRKIEYVAALEVGLNPRKAAPEREVGTVVGFNRRRAATGRVHAHVLLYNLHSIRLEDLGRLWREINQIKKLDEPLIGPYTPGLEGIQYCLKSLGSDADNIILSPKWGQDIQSGMGPSPV